MQLKHETYFVHRVNRTQRVDDKYLSVTFCVSRTFVRATANSGEDIPELARTFLSAFHGDNASLWEAVLDGSKMIWTRPETISLPQELRERFMEEVEKELRLFQ